MDGQSYGGAVTTGEDALDVAFRRCHTPPLAIRA